MGRRWGAAEVLSFTGSGFSGFVVLLCTLMKGGLLGDIAAVTEVANKKTTLMAITV